MSTFIWSNSHLFLFTWNSMGGGGALEIRVVFWDRYSTYSCIFFFLSSLTLILYRTVKNLRKAAQIFAFDGFNKFREFIFSSQLCSIDFQSRKFFLICVWNFAPTPIRLSFRIIPRVEEFCSRWLLLFTLILLSFVYRNHSLTPTVK